MTAPGPAPAARPWGRIATFSLGLFALLAGQMAALMALTWWYGVAPSAMPDFSGNGVAITLVIFVSTPIQVGLLILLSQRTGMSAAEYLGWITPRRSELIVGAVVVVAVIVGTNTISWFLGRGLVTQFQADIYRTADSAGLLPLLLLWIAVVVLTPIGEETLFRGFLFRGWLNQSRDTWPVIALTALIWALVHVQYDWYVTGQIFVFGLLLGWIRWATGSVLLTTVLHGVINAEGMLETVVQSWLYSN